MTDFNITIIGAGVVGLSVAYNLSNYFTDILVVEREDTYGTGISSRNSEVIHAGIYYPENSLKAKLCVRGRKLLYDFCTKFDVPHKKIGKLIIAEKGEEDELIELYQKGIKNGVENLSLIHAKQIKEIEPNVKGEFAIYSKETGILDTHSLMKRLYQLGKQNDVFYAFGKEVTALNKTNNSYLLWLRDGEKISTKYVINSAGLNSDKIASMAGIDIEKEGYKIRYCKGDYFYYSKKPVVSRLIYPIPHTNLKGLGVHITLDLGGRMKFGPSAYFVENINYSVDTIQKDYFYQSAKKLVDGIDENFIFPDTTGIRPKLEGDGVRDFIINEESQKGLEGFINLVGIESPGLTSCLAIGEYVTDIVRGLTS